MTAEFGQRLGKIIEERDRSAASVANAIGLNHSHITRAIHGDRELTQIPVLNLIEILGIPENEQAEFLLLSMSVPQETIDLWINAWRASNVNVEPVDFNNTLRKYLKKEDLETFSADARIDLSYLRKRWGGAKKGVPLTRRYALNVCEVLPIPWDLKASTFLQIVGFDTNIVSKALNSDRSLNEIDEEKLESVKNTNPAHPAKLIEVPAVWKMSPVDWSKQPLATHFGRILEWKEETEEI